MTQADLIRILNPKIRGWANYHRTVVSKAIFSKVDHLIWKALWKWSVRRHPSKGERWIYAKYFHRVHLRNHIFQSITKQDGKIIVDVLFLASSVSIKRHIKIRKQATPFDMEHDRYFEERTSEKWRGNKAGRIKVKALWRRQLGCCPICLEKITKQTNWIIHWHKSKLEGAQDNLDNLSLLHPKCIKQTGNKQFV